jgi:flavin reductase (DIM6/NTAB) family NADH-FMN oxidoreductase RutF
MESVLQRSIQSLDISVPIWDRLFTIAPLVIIGTKEGASYDLAPKHMATPLGFGNYFGFVCTPRHATYHNVMQTGEFTVSFPVPDQIVHTSLSATPRSACITKSDAILQTLSMVQATTMDAPMIAGAYLYLECALFKIIDGFDDYSLITGTIKAAHVDRKYLRVSDQDEAAQIKKHPLLAYLAQGRFARIDETYNFPFPKDFKK